MPKIDGTSFCAWADNYGNIHCGSRHREITLEHDNADSMLFFTTEKRFEKLRQFLIDNPWFIVYGEWIGGVAGRSKIGTIKQYKSDGLWIFGLYDTYMREYLPYPKYKKILVDGDIYSQVIPCLSVFHNATIDNINGCVENHFDLPDNVLGEGIVLWNYDYRDEFGHFKIAKIVNAESKVGKGRVKNKNLPVDNIEKTIVDAYVVDADCEKAKQKACVKFGLEQFEINKGTMGFYLNCLYQDLIEEEWWSILKKFKQPTVQFGLLRQLVYQKGRQYLGLV